MQATYSSYGVAIVRKVFFLKLLLATLTQVATKKVSGSVSLMHSLNVMWPLHTFVQK